MSEIIGYKIQQIVDNGQAIQMSLAEDVQTEPVSQKQLIMENVSKKLDQDMRKQIFQLQCQKTDTRNLDDRKLDKF